MLSKEVRNKLRKFQLKEINLVKEKWYFHPKINNYVISIDGEVKNLLTNKILKWHETSQGYYQVNIYYLTKRKTYLIHRLVTETFLFIKNPELYEVNHMDGNKRNNNINNLEWTTRQENLQHARDNKLFKKQLNETNGRCKITNKEVKDIRELFKLGFKVKEIVKSYNIEQTQVYRILKGVSR